MPERFKNMIEIKIKLTTKIKKNGRLNKKDSFSGFKKVQQAIKKILKL